MQHRAKWRELQFEFCNKRRNTWASVWFCLFYIICFKDKAPIENKLCNYIQVQSIQHIVTNALNKIDMDNKSVKK